MRIVCAILLSIVAGCVPQVADMVQGANHMAGDLNRQLAAIQGLREGIAVDPMLDGRTGQQTKASALMQSLVADALPQSGAARMVGLDEQTLAASRLIATGVITALQEKDQYRMNIAVSDRETGKVVATTAARFLDAALDAKPTAAFNDAPAIAIDQSVAGYIRTAEALVGARVDDSYLKQVPAAALLAQAVSAYNSGKWGDALASYESALARPEGMQLRALNGLYAAQVKLSKKKEAEQTFGRIMAAGFANNDLAIKMLFKPNHTSFWPDPAVSSQYPMWLRQIAAASQASDKCMAIVGHASHSGEEAYSRELSLERAKTIRQKIDGYAPGFAKRTEVYGAGWSENLVGNGKDDASDAIDRRVEFRLRPCGQPALTAAN